MRSPGLIAAAAALELLTTPSPTGAETKGWVDEDAIEMEDEGREAIDVEDDAEVAPSPRASVTRRRRHVRDRRTIYARAGVLHVAPNATSGERVLSDVAGPARLAVDNGPIAGSSAAMGGVTTPALIVGYAVEVGGGELGLETVLAPPVTFELRAEGTVAEESLAPTVLGTVPTGIPPLGSELGETKALPPVVTIVYRAWRGRRARPYVGLGASYLHTYDSKITNPTMNEVAAPRLIIAGAASGVGQLGVDVRVVGRIHVTLDVKAMSGFRTSARVENIQMRTPAFPLYESVYVGTVSVDVVTRPVLVTLGAGASF